MPRYIPVASLTPALRTHLRPLALQPSRNPLEIAPSPSDLINAMSPGERPPNIRVADWVKKRTIPRGTETPSGPWWFRKER